MGVVLIAGPVEAQYQYTDDKGVTKVTQYKLNVPEPYRDSAIWIGPTGVGYPALSEEQQKVKQRNDAYRRIGIANEQLISSLQGGGRGSQEGGSRGSRGGQERGSGSHRGPAEDSRGTGPDPTQQPGGSD
jgi:hypothetical protein